MMDTLSQHFWLFGKLIDATRLLCVGLSYLVITVDLKLGHYRRVLLLLLPGCPVRLHQRLLLGQIVRCRVGLQALSEGGGFGLGRDLDHLILAASDDVGRRLVLVVLVLVHCESLEDEGENID